MVFRAFLSIYAVLAALAGATLILAPEFALAGFGVTLSPMGLVIYQFWGAALMGLGLMAWAARATEAPGPRRAFALALFVANALSCVMALRGQGAGANALGWSNVALFGLLAAAFAALALRPQR